MTDKTPSDPNINTKIMQKYNLNNRKCNTKCTLLITKIRRNNIIYIKRVMQGFLGIAVFIFHIYL